MNFIKKHYRLLLMALVIAFTALIKIDIPYFGSGFVIAIDVIILAVLIYSFRARYSAMQLAVLAAVFSPVSRLLAEYNNDYSCLENIILVMPDAIFFIVYGLIFTLCLRSLSEERMPLDRYLLAVFFSDLIGNAVEFSVMTLASSLWDQTISLDRIFVLVLIALTRTTIVYIIVVSMESYANGLLILERGKKFNFLVNQSITISDEFRLLEGNKADVENVMKDAYALYNELKENGYPDEYVQKTLNIARGAHEIKGAYQGVITSLDKLRRDSEKKQSLKMSDILKFIKTNSESRARSEGKDCTVKIKQDVDFVIDESYKMISIIRNLVNNALEAMDKEIGTIQVSVSRAVPEGETEDFYKIVVKDNAGGIPEEHLSDIFLPGYSTKMDYDTGSIQRGLGLPLVKEYIEYDFNGILQIDSTYGFGTKFTIYLPVEEFEQ